MDGLVTTAEASLGGEAPDPPDEPHWFTPRQPCRSVSGLAETSNLLVTTAQNNFTSVSFVLGGIVGRRGSRGRIGIWCEDFW